MDSKIGKWIIEYLLHQKSIDDKIINTLISTLPFPNNDTRIQKTLILRKIDFEISNGTLSENILEFLEIIAKLDKSEGKTASYSLKEAYCMVAVDCTARFLPENDDGKYREAVERVWRNRVCKAEELGSEVAEIWWKDIEGAVRDSRVCERVILRNTRNEGLMAVRRFLKEAWECLGPTFLECVAVKVGDDELEVIRSGGGGGSGGVVGSGNPCHEVGTDKGIQKSQANRRRKHVASKTKCPRGAKTSDTDEDSEKVHQKNSDACNSDFQPDISQAIDNDDNNDVGPHNPEEVDRVLSHSKLTGNSNNSNTVENLARPVLDVACEAAQGQELFKSSVLEENQAGAETNVGPEVEPAQQSETNSVGSTKKNPEISVENRVGQETNVGPETNSMGSTEKTRKNVKKRSLVEPNGTSHTLEWDDSEDNLSGSGRVSLPRSSKKAKADPVQSSVDKRMSRRQRRMWTPQEEETLRKGVKKFGSRWKLIHGCYPEEFADRTEIDLKDKWRNLLKRV